MKALAWHGKHDVRIDNVPDPGIVNPRDCIIKVTSTAICGSDLHLYDGYIPTMQAGDILGHEFMGEVVEVGAKSTLKKGQRVVVPFTIACGSLLSLRQASIFGLRQRPARRQSGHRPGAVRPADERAVRLQPHDRRLCRGPGRICPRAVQRCRPDRHSRRASRTTRCCSSPTSCRPAGRPPSTHRSSPAIPSRYGVAARSACSRCSRRS